MSNRCGISTPCVRGAGMLAVGWGMRYLVPFAIRTREKRTTMLRERFNEALKDAMKTKEQRVLSTVRMILAKLKDKDIDARGRGITTGIEEGEILAMLQGMVKQRQESMALFEQGGRPELAQQEGEEIQVIERFLPKQMSESEALDAIRAIIAETGAASLKDMGKVMAELRARYAGQMDFGKASGLIKQQLSAG